MSLKYSDWHKKNSVFHKLWQWVEINLKSTQNCLEGNSQHLLNSTPDGCNGTILMCSYWLPSTWGHKHIKIIVIGLWNTSLCKILIIFFLFIVCVITDRGFISSDSSFTLEIIKFSTEGKRWERPYHHFLFSSGLVRITKTSLILGLLVVWFNC